MTLDRQVNFGRLASLAGRHCESILRRWLPDGERRGAEWVATNPTRIDRHKGSFKVNVMTGRWSDFATGDRGGDLIGLAAYLFRLTQKEAALKVAEMLGIDPYE